MMSLEDNLKYNTKEFEQYGGEYAKYDNYDTIEVGKVKLIPSDYDGVMGVPISFFDIYSLEQFEILGSLQFSKIKFIRS